jgi:oxalate---CoA ligase
MNSSLPTSLFSTPGGELVAAVAPEGSIGHDGTIGSAIALHARGAGDSPALVGLDSPQVSYSQLDATITSFGGHLANAGLAREDRVALLVPPGVKGAQLVVALACNVTLVPVNPALTAHELMDVLKVSGLAAVVIPAWVKTPARSAILAQGLPVLEAVTKPDGALGLEFLTPARGEARTLRPVSESDTAVLLRSSGTTGAAKLIPVTHGNLVKMAAKMGSPLWYHLSAQDRAACTSPLHYAAGLKTSLFVPLVLGASVALPPPGRTSELAEWVDVLKPTYLSVSPGPLNGMLDRLKVAGHGISGASLRFVMCGSAYLAEDVRLAAESLLHAPVLEFYGLSEAGVMAANPAPPGKNKPETVGLPAPGELLVMSENGEPVATGTVGQIAVYGSAVTPGYLTTDGTQPADFKDGWLYTGDLGCIDEDGYLTIVGRLKEVINRGGEKVFPYEIEKAILEHPAVVDAAAFGVPHPRLGENVAAAVVLKPGATLSEQDLKIFLASRLASFKMPRRLSFESTLPRGKTGKVLRSVLSEKLAHSRHVIVAPDRLLEWELRGIWERLLGTDDIGIDDDFFEIGGDSLLATEMLIEVEKIVGKPYPQSELSMLTIRRMADVMTSALSAGRDLMTQVRSGPGIPLFFCHGDYATRGIYAQKLAALLPNDRPVFLLHCYSDRLLGSSIEDMANAYLNEVLRVAPGSAVFVGGYCNGGLAAWHLAHLLRTKGVEVVELLLVETMSINARGHLRLLPGLLRIAAAVVPGRAGKFLRDEAMRVVWSLKRKLGRFSYGVVRNKIARALKSTRAPERAKDELSAADAVYFGFMSRYVPPRADFPVTCFIAEEGKRFETKSRSWRRLAPAVGEVIVPGTHHTAVISERQSLANALTAALNRGSVAYKLREHGRERAHDVSPVSG